MREVLAVLDAELQAAIAQAGPVCLVSGRCCRFAEYGHTLFVSSFEVDRLLDEAPPPCRPLDDGATCPWQDGHGQCTARAARPLGCRVYFCDRSSFAWQGALTEAALADVRALHDRHALPYRYGEWREMLELLACHPER